MSFFQAERRADRERLFCFPHAGAGAAPFARWSEYLPWTVLTAVRPGRERRLSEPVVTDLGRLADAIADELGTLADVPYRFFGHSLGALIAFEVARRFCDRGCRLPLQIFVSARRAPDLKPLYPPIHHLPDDAFVEAIQARFSAIPPALLARRAMLNLFLPALKADQALLDTYVYRPGPRLAVPLVGLAGEDDPHTPESDLCAWARHTDAGFRHRLLPGGHFYFQPDPRALLETLVTLAAP